MQIVKIKCGKESLFFPLTFPHEIKGQSFVYFINGKGYKKTKSFQILEEEIPERWSGLSWLEIMYIHEKYGIHCSGQYAETKCAGFVAERNTLARFALFQKAKHLLCRQTDGDFFELVQPDSLLASLGIYMIDMVATDYMFGKKDPEYQPEATLYQGKPCSMCKYIEQKFGKRYADIIEMMSENVVPTTN